jgi:hypothetical protein
VNETLLPLFMWLHRTKLAHSHSCCCCCCCCTGTETLQLWDWLLATDDSAPGGDVAAVDLTEARQMAAAAAATSNAAGALQQVRWLVFLVLVMLSQHGASAGHSTAADGCSSSINQQCSR